MEDERLKERLARVHEAQEYHSQLEDYHNQVLELRSKTLVADKRGDQNLLNSQAGIGTEQRERAEKKRKRQSQHHVPANESLAIYVSNLPTDGSVTDQLMEALFGSYGSLRKIHFYRDKATDELKGDALVIYNLDRDTDKSSLVESVCSQVCQKFVLCQFSVRARTV